MRRHTPTLITTAAIALLIPAAAGAAGTPTPSMPASSPAPTATLPLEGMRWHLREYRAEDGGMAGASGGWIRLDGGALTGSTGCNDLAGSYAVDGDTLTFSGITPTEASCLDGDLVGQEMAVLARLPQVVRFTFQTARGHDATDLVLVDAADGGHLAFKSLQGRTWTPGYVPPEPMPEGYVRIRFEDGTASGQGPCNTFRGPFTQDDLRIAIGPLESSRETCPDLGLETMLLSELQDARSYGFEPSGDLVLYDEQGSPIRAYLEERTGD
jgi:heat shock protein HslJ